jgi:hypothetical protein
MEKPATEKAPAKTEAELIATVANIQDAERSLLFAQRAIKAGMPALAAACEERAKALTPIKPPRAKKKPAPVKVAEANPLQEAPAE